MMEKLTDAHYAAALKLRSPLIPSVPICLLLAGIAIPAYNQGVVLGGEVVLLGLFAMLMPVIAKNRFLRTTWAVALLWCGAQLVSDWVHGTEMFSALTFAGPMSALLVTGLFWLHSEFQLSLQAIMATVGLGWVGLTLIAGTAMASANPWKYGLATPIIVTVIAFAYLWKLRRRSIVVLLLLLAGVSLIFDSRFITGMLLGCAVALMVAGEEGRVSKRGVGRLVILAAAGLALYLAYPSIALSGVIGQRAQLQQVLYDSQGSNFLLATRLEFPQMVFLVAQNPFLGIGSWGRLNVGDAYSALTFLNDHVAPLSPNTVDYLLNPTEGYPGYNSHSSAMASALFAGVLALPFWIFLFVSIIRSVIRFTRGQSVMPALLLYMGGLSLWDLFFSPLTTRSHVELAVMLFLAGATLGWNQSTQVANSTPSGQLGLTRELRTSRIPSEAGKNAG
jgi:hypothetical protein